MEKQLVFPGEQVADSAKNIPGCYVEDGRTFAASVSIRQNDYVVPLKGVYVPRTQDDVVGVVTEERFSSYTLDLNSPYEGQVSTRETREEFKLGDVVACKILAVNEIKQAVLVEPHPLAGARVLSIEAVKVPRIIGRNGSMLDVLQQYTGSRITVGKNGYVAIQDGNVNLAVAAIEKIGREAHVSGLTERITKMLQEKGEKQNG
ncbi:MAG: KH domain-containing protein [Candidatus Micrarchaeota archaeon]|nr:KH domain-containing protein [Candidatus Micrarchaeota archaeon]